MLIYINHTCKKKCILFCFKRIKRISTFIINGIYKITRTGGYYYFLLHIYIYQISLRSPPPPIVVIEPRRWPGVERQQRATTIKASEVTGRWRWNRMTAPPSWRIGGIRGKRPDGALCLFVSCRGGRPPPDLESRIARGRRTVVFVLPAAAAADNNVVLLLLFGSVLRYRFFFPSPVLPSSWRYCLRGFLPESLVVPNSPRRNKDGAVRYIKSSPKDDTPIPVAFERERERVRKRGHPSEMRMDDVSAVDDGITCKRSGLRSTACGKTTHYYYPLL